MFANDFDINFNCGKSVAMRIGKRFKEKCVPLQIDNKDYVTELKYLAVHVCAGQLLKFSVDIIGQSFTVLLIVFTLDLRL